ncbi:MAG TPA: DUF4157 domain-containing protein [Kofleriaceae bacterium]|jgi:hypothetical protein
MTFRSAPRAASPPASAATPTPKRANPPAGLPIFVQTSARPFGAAPADAPPGAPAASDTSAQRPILDRMAGLFGADLDDVRLHEHSPAAGSAKAIARGTDVHLAGAATDPHVLAHELAHVVQATAPGPAAPVDALEAEAHQAADLVASGRPARVGLAAQSGAEYAYTDATGNVIPDPVDVTWNGDTFHLELRRTEDDITPQLKCKLTYTGAHAMDPANKVFELSVALALATIHASIVRQNAVSLEIDLFGDGHQIIRISDQVNVLPGQGRLHAVEIEKNRQMQVIASFTIHDPKAKASDLQAPPPDERPGMPTIVSGTLDPNETWTTTIDSDGDQYPDLGVAIQDLTKGTSATRRLKVTLTPTGSTQSAAVEFDLPPPARGWDGLMPMVKQLNDGGRATILTLTNPAEQAPSTLVIDPPTRTATATTYHVTAPSFAWTTMLSASKSHEVFGAGSATVIGNIVSTDLTLGAYKDVFRFTVQPRSATTAELGISQLDGGEPHGARGAPLTIAAAVRFNEIAMGSTSYGLDLDGDGKPELVVYDQLGAGFPDGPDPENDRDHTIRIVGAAIGGERSFEFRVRDGRPSSDGSRQGDDLIAGWNAMAVNGLREQQTDGTTMAQRLAAYELAMIAERAKAVPTIITQATFARWAALSESMIELQGQHPIDPQLRGLAATQATAFFTMMEQDTAAGETSHANHWTTWTDNPYTDSHQVDSAPEHGAGPDLAADILSDNVEVAVAHYQQLVGGLDQWILDQTAATQRGPDVDRLKLVVGTRRELGELDALGAQPVLAVFQPDAQFENEQGYVSQVPLSLYYWKEGTTWHLRNISNPEHVYSVTADAGANDAESLQELMAKLDDPDRLPKGLIHYEIPGKTAGEVETTDGMTWKKALTYLGLALAAAGFTLATFGSGAVEVAGVIATAGSGLVGAAAAGIDLVDKAQHDDLNAKTAVLDLAQIVSGIAGASAVTAGKITVAAANAPAGARWAGNWARVAMLSSKLYLPAQRIDAAATAVSFAVVTVDMAAQLDKLDRDGKLRLLVQWAGMGTLTALQIKGALPKAGTTKTLVLSPGPDGMPVATLALDKNSVIVDSNVAMALEEEKRVGYDNMTQPGEQRMVDMARKRGVDNLRVTDRSVSEAREGATGELAHRGTPIAVERTSKPYTDTLEALDGPPGPVGRAKGGDDRELVADALFAVTEPGVTPTLATHDPGIYNNLARRALPPIDPKKLGKSVAAAFPDGFDVVINGRPLHVLPIPKS